MPGVLNFPRINFDNKIEIISAALKGVKPSAFISFAKHADISEKFLAGLLQIHQRTIQNYREKEKRLDPVQSEHLLKLMALYIKGEEVFGTIEEFNSWLHKPAWNNKTSPVEWLVTPGGIDLVYEELEGLANGYPA